MMKRKIPTGQALEDEKRFYATASIPELEQRANQLGMSYGSYRRQMNLYGARKPQDVLNPGAQSDMQALADQVLKIVSEKGSSSLGELSRILDRSKETIVKLVDMLREQHYEVNLDEASKEVIIPHQPSADFKPTGFNYFRRTVRFGLVADTQLGSRYQQMTLLHDAYAIMDSRQLQFILHLGDLVDGIDMYRGHREELFKYDAEQQLDYVVENYPKSQTRLKTYVIGGQHDRSFYKQNGYNILRHLCERRPDFRYRGFFKAEFPIRGVLVNVQHPGGGVSYARSYRIQKIIENMVGFILSASGSEIPKLVAFGHWHISAHLPNYMGIDAVSLPHIFKRRVSCPV
jgi:hypothetical protein